MRNNLSIGSYLSAANSEDTTFIWR